MGKLRYIPVAPPRREKLLPAMVDAARSARPIIRREFVGLLRTRKAFWITVLTVAAASLVPLTAWPAENSATPFTRALAAFSAYSTSLGLAFFFFVPAITAGAITTERERGTYELLYCTQTSPAGIVLGKLIASTGFFILLLVLTFPMAAVLYLVGGFQASEFGTTALEIAQSIFFLGVASLWASVSLQRTFQALIRAFVFLILCHVLVSIASNILVFMFFRPLMRSPLSYMTYYRIANAALDSIVCLVLLVSLIRRAAFPDPEGKPRRPGRYYPSQGPRARRRGWLTRLALAPVKGGIPDGWNPVFAASLMSKTFAETGIWRYLAVGLGLLGLGVVVLFAVSGGGFINLIDVLLQIVPIVFIYLIAFVMPGASTVSLTSERDLGNLDFLRGTHLSSAQVVWGKFWASSFNGMKLALLGGAACAVLVLFAPEKGPFSSQPDRLEIPLAFLATGAAVCLFCVASGLLAATLFRTTLACVTTAYVLVGVVLVAIPMTLHSLSSTPSWSSFANSLSPPLAFFGFLSSSLWRSGSADAAQTLAVSLGISLGLMGLATFAAVQVLRRRWTRGD